MNEKISQLKQNCIWQGNIVHSVIFLMIIIYNNTSVNQVFIILCQQFTSRVYIVIWLQHYLRDNTFFDN